MAPDVLPVEAENVEAEIATAAVGAMTAVKNEPSLQFHLRHLFLLLSLSGAVIGLETECARYAKANPHSPWVALAAGAAWGLLIAFLLACLLVGLAF